MARVVHTRRGIFAPFKNSADRYWSADMTSHH